MKLQLSAPATLLLSLTPLISAASPIVETTHGKVKGFRQVAVKLSQNSVVQTEAFLGIPYAEPPVADRRFAAPEDASKWSSTKDATRFGFSCPIVPDTVFDDATTGKKFHDSDMWNSKHTDEDCLTLNVWRPYNTRKSSRLPVAVWIYGGGFFSGTSNLDVYDGKVLSGVGRVIVFSLNYRIGPLGFLPPIPGTNSVGNVGLLDQRLALRWIYENAANFGGDRDKITIMGESAGGVSVGLQVLNKYMKEPLVDRGHANEVPADVPYTNTYFNNAVQQSGTPNTGWSYIYKEEAYKRLALLAKELKCYIIGSLNSNRFSVDEQAATFKNILACLKQKTAQEIVEAQWVLPNKAWLFPFLPVVGGPMLRYAPDTMMKLFLSHKNEIHTPTNFITGWNTNEGSWLNMYAMEGLHKDGNGYLTEEEFARNLKKTFMPMSPVSGHLTREKYVPWGQAMELKAFNTTTGKIGGRNAFLRDALNEMTGDFHIVCPSLEYVRRLSENPNRKVFNYILDHRMARIAWPDWAGVMHGYEIELMFGLPLRARKINQNDDYTEADRRYSAIMVKYWLNFIHHGDPNISFMKQQDESRYLQKTDGSEYLSFKMPQWAASSSNDCVHILFGNLKYVKNDPQQLALSKFKNPRADLCYFWKYTVPMVNEATQSVESAYFDWQEDMRRWRAAMEAYETTTMLGEDLS